MSCRRGARPSHPPPPPPRTPGSSSGPAPPGPARAVPAVRPGWGHYRGALAGGGTAGGGGSSSTARWVCQTGAVPDPSRSEARQWPPWPCLFTDYSNVCACVCVVRSVCMCLCVFLCVRAALCVCDTVCPCGTVCACGWVGVYVHAPECVLREGCAIARAREVALIRH